MALFCDRMHRSTVVTIEVVPVVIVRTEVEVARAVAAGRSRPIEAVGARIAERRPVAIASGQLRKQIDECDDSPIQELAKRMRVAREIGMFKKENGVTVFQNTRYNEILEKRTKQGEQSQMSGEFMKKIFEAIHEESVRQQMEIINK